MREGRWPEPRRGSRMRWGSCGVGQVGGGGRARRGPAARGGRGPGGAWQSARNVDGREISGGAPLLRARAGRAGRAVGDAVRLDRPMGGQVGSGDGGRGGGGARAAHERQAGRRSETTRGVRVASAPPAARRRRQRLQTEGWGRWGGARSGRVASPHRRRRSPTISRVSRPNAAIGRVRSRPPARSDRGLDPSRPGRVDEAVPIRPKPCGRAGPRAVARVRIAGRLWRAPLRPRSVVSARAPRPFVGSAAAALGRSRRPPPPCLSTPGCGPRPGVPPSLRARARAAPAASPARRGRPPRRLLSADRAPCSPAGRLSGVGMMAMRRRGCAALAALALVAALALPLAASSASADRVPPASPRGLRTGEPVLNAHGVLDGASSAWIAAPGSREVASGDGEALALETVCSGWRGGGAERSRGAGPSPGRVSPFPSGEGRWEVVAGARGEGIGRRAAGGRVWPLCARARAAVGGDCAGVGSCAGSAKWAGGGRGRGRRGTERVAVEERDRAQHGSRLA